MTNVEFKTEGSGAVDELVVVERVDRDGDGYASGFQLKVVSDTRPKDPKENGQAGRSTAKLFSVLIGGPFKKLHNFFTKEASDEFFTPGQVMSATTTDGTRDVGTYRPVGPKRYFGPGEKTDETPLYVGTAREDKVWSHESHAVEMSRFLGPDEGRTTIEHIRLEACWDPEARGSLTGKDFDACLQPTDIPDEGFAAILDSLYGTPPFIFTPEKPLKVESPEQDQTETMTVTSNVDGAVVTIDRERVGTTPWTGEVPTDVGRDGPVRVTVADRGYLPETRRMAEPRDIDTRLTKIEQPITVRTATPGATVFVDGEVVGVTPWSGERWVEGSYDVFVSADGKAPRQFTGVRAGDTISTELVNDSLITSITEPSLDDTSPSGSTDTSTETTGDNSSESELMVTNTDLTAAALEADLRQIRDVELIASRFEASETTVGVREPVTLTAGQSHSLLGSITAYEWSFGDGSTTGRLSTSSRTHAYASPGTYTVELTVRDGNGNTDTSTKTITVEDTSPQAVFAPSTFDARTGESVSFDARGSTDAEGPISSYRWTFGDGSSATGPTQTHAYASGGIYTVRLTVTDDGGNTAVREKIVTVTVPNAQPIAAFTSSVDREAGTVTLDASASNDDDGTITQYVWFFENGTVMTGERVTYDAPATDSRDVELLVIDDVGSSATVTEPVENAAEGRTKTTPTTTAAAPSTTDDTPGEQTSTATAPPTEESDEGILDMLGKLLRELTDALG
ncbi:PKD domain-containing protein [Natronomonas salsuginis]|nr:PKD domain-containing protein [Natronomonas salsuginis]